MRTRFLFGFLALLAFPAFAQEDGFYVNGVSASTAKGAKLLVTELIVNHDDHGVCYSGDYQSALDNTHDSISISVVDVYGESDFPPLDVEVSAKDGRSAYGIVSSCD